MLDLEASDSGVACSDGYIFTVRNCLELAPGLSLQHPATRLQDACHRANESLVAGGLLAGGDDCGT